MYDNGLVSLREHLLCLVGILIALIRVQQCIFQKSPAAAVCVCEPSGEM